MKFLNTMIQKKLARLTIVISLRISSSRIILTVVTASAEATSTRKEKKETKKCLITTAKENLRLVHKGLITVLLINSKSPITEEKNLRHLKKSMIS
jgi:hypothetical protein